MSRLPDDEVTRRYREASDRLGETPSSDARAAILAAAAREVWAQSRDALAPARPLPLRRSRWPLGAAAAVLLSTLAVLLAGRTERESGGDIITMRSDAPAPAAGVPPPAPAAAPVIREQEAEPKRAEASSAAPARQRAPEQTPAPAAPPVAARAAPSDAAVAAAPPPPPSPVVERDARANRAGEERAAADSALAKEERQTASAEKPKVTAAAPAASMGGLSARRTEGAIEPTAAAWLERIVELRRKGDHEAADAELKKFRERYPEVVIPPAALPAVGTR